MQKTDRRIKQFEETYNILSGKFMADFADGEGDEQAIKKNDKIKV